MDDQFPKDENSAKVDYVVPESGPGEEALGFSAKAQQEKFLGGQSEVSKIKEFNGHKIKYEFFFAPHYSPADIKGLEERFRKADVYIPEANAWTQEQLDILRDIANGNIDVTQKIPGEEDGSPERRYSIIFMRMLYNSHKPITFIDVPAADVPAAESKEQKAVPNFATFSDTLNSMREAAANLVKGDKTKEQYMLDHLEPKMKELMEEYPSLKEKKEISVLLSLGTAHDPIYIDLKKRGGETVRFFGHPSPVFSFMDEGARRLRFNRSIDDKLAARMYLEMKFNGEFKKDLDKLTDDTSMSVKLVRKVVNQFGLEDAREEFETSKSGQDSRQIMESMLARKGIKIPQSQKEMDEFLAKPLSKVESV